MVGTRSRTSLRLENLAGMVCPNEPIGPDGGGSFDILVAPGADDCWAPVPVVAGPLPPADGCRDLGWTSAAQASSGVGMFSVPADCGPGWGAAPVLICPVFGTRPGFVGRFGSSCAKTAAPSNRTAAATPDVLKKQREFFMGSLHRLRQTTAERRSRLHCAGAKAVSACNRPMRRHEKSNAARASGRRSDELVLS